MIGAGLSRRDSVRVGLAQFLLLAFFFFSQRNILAEFLVLGDVGFRLLFHRLLGQRSGLHGDAQCGEQDAGLGFANFIGDERGHNVAQGDFDGGAVFQQGEIAQEFFGAGLAAFHFPVGDPVVEEAIKMVAAQARGAAAESAGQDVPAKGKWCGQLCRRDNVLAGGVLLADKFRDFTETGQRSGLAFRIGRVGVLLHDFFLNGNCQV